ncbi:MAG: hypothetical protein AB1342_03275 [Pseudomonadota bacterium]
MTSTTDFHHESEMKWLKMMIEADVHFELALAAAVFHCANYTRPPPIWIAQLLCRKLLEPSAAWGEKNGPVKKYIQARKDYRRWEAVSHAVSEQYLSKLERKKLNGIKSERKPTEIELERANLYLVEGKYWSDAVKVAAADLKDTGAEGSEQTVRKSYAKIKRAAESDPNWRMRYYRFDIHFLEFMNINVDFRKLR